MKKNMKKLTNNAYFWELLQQADEYELVEVATNYLTYPKQQESLLANEEYLHDFLRENFPDFGFTKTEDKSIIHTENALFLATKNRAEKIEIYRGFTTSYSAIDDLYILELDERQEILLELGIDFG